MAWTRKDGRAFNTITGTQTMKQHRIAKRDQAEVRNEFTPVERTKQYRLATPEQRTILEVLDAGKKKESAS